MRPEPTFEPVTFRSRSSALKGKNFNLTRLTPSTRSGTWAASRRSVTAATTSSKSATASVLSLHRRVNSSATSSTARPSGPPPAGQRWLLRVFPSSLNIRFPPARPYCLSFPHQLAFTTGAWQPGGLNYWSPLTITYPAHQKIKLWYPVRAGRWRSRVLTFEKYWLP